MAKLRKIQAKASQKPKKAPEAKHKFKLAEEWCAAVVKAYAPKFKRLGYALPPVVVSPGFTSKGGRNMKVSGECWSPKASADSETRQIFLNPRLHDPVYIAHVIVHELIHAVVGVEEGHTGKFAQLGKALGFEGKMTKSNWGDEAKAECEAIVKKLGAYPRPAFSGLVAPGKKQSTRLIKAACPDCGYTIRITRKWLERAIPRCPDVDCEGYDMEMEVIL